MSAEEHRKEVEKAIEQQGQQDRKREEEYINLMARQAWKRLLRVTDRQCKLIEQKREKAHDLYIKMRVGATGCEGNDEQSFRWHRWSKSTGGVRAKAPDEMTEGKKIADKLIDLMRKESASDEEIRQKIDALQQVREKARKELPKARRELAAVLTTPRQEAVLLLIGYID
jgi:hypothetical protein